jgi:hypothetical protein
LFELYYTFGILPTRPVPVAARYKAWVCGRSVPGITGSNSTGGSDIRFLLLLFFARYRYLRGADNSTRGDLQDAVFLIVIMNPRP